MTGVSSHQMLRSWNLAAKMEKNKHGCIYFFLGKHCWWCDSKSNICIPGLNLTVSPTRDTHRHSCEQLPCCIGWNHSYLTLENVFGCPWRGAVRDEGRRSANGGERREELERLDSRHLYSSLLVCDDPGKVRKARRATHKHSGDVGNTMAKSMLRWLHWLVQMNWDVFLI